MESVIFDPTCNRALVWWKSVPAFSARGMTFQVSCRGCHVRGSGYKLVFKKWFGGGVGGA